MGGVIETFAAAEITHNRRPGVDAYPGCTELHASLFHFLDKIPADTVHRQRTVNGPLGMIGLVQRRVEYPHHRVADDLVDGAAVLHDGATHRIEVFIQHRDQQLRAGAFSKGSKPGDIRKEKRHLPGFAIEAEPVRVVYQLVYQGRGHVGTESLAHLALLPGLGKKAVEYVHCDNGDDRKQRQHR